MIAFQRGLFIIGVVACFALLQESTCKNLVHCPCGDTGKNVTFCIPEWNTAEISCRTWSGCKKCQNGLDRCVECPQGFGGPLCTVVQSQRKESGMERNILQERPLRMLRNRRSSRTDSGRSRRSSEKGTNKCGLIGVVGRMHHFTCNMSRIYSCDIYCDNVHQGHYRCFRGGRWNKELPPCVLTKGFSCGVPENPENGRVTYPSLEYRSELKYVCDKGFQLSRKDPIFCSSDGTWNRSDVLCAEATKASCNNPGEVENGKFAIFLSTDNSTEGLFLPSPYNPTFPEGTLLQYSCFDNFILQGNPSLSCEPSGKWSENPPVCQKEDDTITATDGPEKRNVPAINGEKDEKLTIAPEVTPICNKPGLVPNGRLWIYPDLDNLPRKYRMPTENAWTFFQGTRLKYMCNNGYTLKGDSTLICEASGKWSADSPICKKEFKSICSNPGITTNGRTWVIPDPENLQRESIQMTEEGWAYSQGTRLQYQCTDGYTLKGDSTLICEALGKWSADPPICVKEDTLICNNPGLVPNSRMRIFPNLDNLPREYRQPTENAWTFFQGTRLKYVCNNGYTLKGDSTLICEASGKWSTGPPVCKKDSGKRVYNCYRPEPIHKEILEIYLPPNRPMREIPPFAEDETEYPPGTRLKYACDDGYSIWGHSERICQDTSFWSSEPPMCIPECGFSFVDSRGKITNGNRTVIGEWPWVVAIAPGVGKDMEEIQCGGVLINNRTVITAAHCLTVSDNFTLFFGKYYRNNNKDDPKVINRTSDRIILHPDYQTLPLAEDIGIVTFSKAVPYTERIQPVCLPTFQTTSSNFIPGKMGNLTGWGKTERHLGSDALLHAQLPVLTNDVCIKSYKDQKYDLYISERMFCAGTADNRQSGCDGDSGSPIVFYDKHTKRFTVEGLVSFGVYGQCGLEGRYTVFTKVFPFLPWIRQNMAV